MPWIKKTPLYMLLLGLLFSSPIVNANIPEDKRQDVDAFINTMVTQHQFNRTELNTLFEHVNLNQSIVDAMNKPHEKLPWYKYRTLFVTDEHVKGGLAFWNQHEAALKRAEKQYGVPAEIITAIIGVETRYGKMTGKYPVIDALSTLAFNYPPRAGFFRKELSEYLLLTREEHIDPLSLKGSYAGAMGHPQFMPSSYRNFAIDFDHDGNRD